MPLLNVDAKALEWVVCVHLARDKVGTQEINNQIDQHTENQKFLKLPEGKEGRLIAKKFVFKLIYGAVAKSFANDFELNHLSKSTNFWQERINYFYNKYQGIELWHEELVKEYVRTGKLVMPTGREYVFPKENLEYLRPKILNYPVQGLGNDLMTIARVSLFKRMKAHKLKSILISTIHDSIVTDAIDEEVDKVCQLINETWDDIPDNYRWLTDNKDALTVPLRCEITIGDNLKDLKPYVNQNPGS